MTTDVIKKVTFQKFAGPVEKLVFYIVLSVWFFVLRFIFRVIYS